MLAFRNALEYWNIDWRVTSGYDPATSAMTVVVFYLATPQFTGLNYVQQASIRTRVSSIRSLWGGTSRHCIDQYTVSLLIARGGGDTAMPSGLHARLCHTFLDGFIRPCDYVEF